jgi:hypothetical protein
MQLLMVHLRYKKLRVLNIKTHRGAFSLDCKRAIN